MMHDALGEHAAAGEFPPAAVRQAQSGLRGPSGARTGCIRTSAGGCLDDSSGGVVAAPARARRRSVAGRTDTAASC